EEIIRSRISGYDTVEVIISVLGILLVLEATRRTVGLPIVIVASITLLYALFGKHIPTQILSLPGFSLKLLASNLWFLVSGLFRSPIQISAIFIFLFLFLKNIFRHKYCHIPVFR